MVENAKFSYVSRKQIPTEISLLLGGRPPLIFRLRGTRPPSPPPPAFDAHVRHQENAVGIPTYLIIQDKRLLSDAFCDYLMHYRMIPGRTYSTSTYPNTSLVSPSTQSRHPARPPPAAQTRAAGRPSRTTPPFPVPTQSLTPPRLGTRSFPPPPRLPIPPSSAAAGWALATDILSQPETAESEDAELCLESHTRLADLVTDASWLLLQLLQLNPDPGWNNPSVHGRMITDTERSEQGCARLMSRESNLTRLWLKWVESESSRPWKSRIWVESESNHADCHLSQNWVNWILLESKLSHWFFEVKTSRSCNYL